MARQGFRVWVARLAAGLLAVVIVLLIGGYWSLQWFLASPPMPTSQGASGSASSQSSEGLGGTSHAGQPITHASSPEFHPLDPVLRLARDALALHRERDLDYTAVLGKRQRWGGKLSEETRMQLKLRSREATDASSPRPIDVYLRFLAPKSQAGREVIWRQGLNNDWMTVHESGFLNLTRVELAPTSRIAMMGNRYPITDVGIERLLLKLIEKGERDRELGDCQVTMKEEVEITGRRCQRVTVTHPEPSPESQNGQPRFDYYQAVIDMDIELQIPIHYASYLWPTETGGEPLLDEEFTYEDLRLNCNLTDLDFDPDNPAYQYPSR